MQPADDGGPGRAADVALERALNLAEAEGVLIPFLVRRAPRASARLTEGERRVLWHLPTELSVPDIAQELGLSVNTVKTHMRHLYAKLGAHRRRDAVREARVNGLLPPLLEGLATQLPPD